MLVLQQAIAAQDQLLGEQQQKQAMLKAKITQLTNTLTPLLAALVASSHQLISHPEKDAGDPAQCMGFMLQCSLYFSGQGVSEHLKSLNSSTSSSIKHSPGLQRSGQKEGSKPQAITISSSTSNRSSITPQKANKLGNNYCQSNSGTTALPSLHLSSKHLPLPM